LRQLVEKTWEFNIDLGIAFIDLQKAFDSVPRGKLWRCLEREYGVSGRMLRAIKSLYEPCLCTVRTGHENGTWFEVKTGVKQGSVLSPLLFIAYIDKVIQKFKEEWIEDTESGIFAYADDIAFWSVGERGIERGLNCWNECFKEAGLKMNKEKTVIMRIDRQDDNEDMNVLIEGERIEEVDSFKYLGSVFHRKGRVDFDVAERISKFGRSVEMFYPFLREENVPLNVKKIIFESILTPLLMYGAECWTTTTKTRSRIQAAEMRPLRTMIGKSRRDRVRNERVRERIGVCPVQKKIEKSQLRWLGHLERMDDQRVAKRCFQWVPEGRRPRGRPRKRWKDEIEEVLEKNGLPELRELRENNAFLDRRNWRSRLNQLTGI
jgi:hypothetical protein